MAPKDLGLFERRSPDIAVELILAEGSSGWPALFARFLRPRITVVMRLSCHSRAMQLKVGIWSALVVVVFSAVLAAASSLLRAVHVHWAAWPIALAGAVVTALAGLAKPLTGVVTQRWADRARSSLDQRDRVRSLEQAVGGRDKGLPLAGEVVDRTLLGIHPSIPLPPGADTSLAADLPLYIRRDLDDDLRQAG
jgi:hypothetical protein